MSWISVKDKKFPKDREILIKNKSNEVYLGHFSEELSIEDNETLVLKFNVKPCSCCYNNYTTEDFIHWMEIPTK